MPATREAPFTSGSFDPNQSLTYRGARRLLGLIVLLILGWSLLQSLRSVLLLFAIVFLIAMILHPAVSWLERHRVPRAVGVLLLLLGLLGLAAGLAAFALPPVLDQVQDLVQRVPELWQKLRAQAGLLAQRYPTLSEALPQADELADALGRRAGPLARVLVRSTVGVVGGVFGLVLGLLLLVFTLANAQTLVAGYLALAPDRYREQAHRTLARLVQQMSAWIRGVLINGVVTGISTGVGLWLVGVQPALVFGALAFLGEFIPNLGPVLVAFPALFVALSLGATKFWLALAVILFVQQVETNLLVPFVLGKEMRLNSVTILFFTLATASVFGLVGAFLAMPAAALFQILVDEFYLRPRKLDQGEIDREAAALLRGKEEGPAAT